MKIDERCGIEGHERRLQRMLHSYEAIVADKGMISKRNGSSFKYMDCCLRESTLQAAPHSLVRWLANL